MRLVAIATKVTAEQREILQKVAEAWGMDEAELLRQIINTYMINMTVGWPDAIIPTHGGKRDGAGRKKGSNPPKTRG